MAVKEGPIEDSNNEEALRKLSHEVVAEMLTHVLQYTRRGSISVLWTALLEHAQRDLNEAVEQSSKLSGLSKIK